MSPPRRRSRRGWSAIVRPRHREKTPARDESGRRLHRRRPAWHATRHLGAQIAFMNNGGVRSDLVPAADGSITFGQLFAMQPFGNNLVVKTLTGAQLKRLLEQQFHSGTNTAARPNMLLPSSRLLLRLRPVAPGRPADRRDDASTARPDRSGGELPGDDQQLPQLGRRQFHRADARDGRGRCRHRRHRRDRSLSEGRRRRAQTRADREPDCRCPSASGGSSKLRSLRLCSASPSRFSSCSVSMPIRKCWLIARS